MYSIPFFPYPASFNNLVSLSLRVKSSSPAQKHNKMIDFYAGTIPFLRSFCSFLTQAIVNKSI